MKTALLIGDQYEKWMRHFHSYGSVFRILGHIMIKNPRKCEKIVRFYFEILLQSGKSSGIIITVNSKYVGKERRTRLSFLLVF